jgi:hypothetical protein
VTAQPSGPKHVLKVIIVLKSRLSRYNANLVPLVQLLVLRLQKNALHVSLDTIALKLG